MKTTETTQEYQSLKSLVGNTPLVKLTDKIYAKLETYNPSGSVKDRMISYLVNEAINSGKINSESTLVEATSGNTGIALSMFGASLGLDVLIVMPSNMSEERKVMMRLYGAKVVEVGPSDFAAAIQLRDEICSSNPNFWTPSQFENLLNVECHKTQTAPEIHKQVIPHGSWSAFVSGAGTGGTIRGVQEYLCDAGLTTKIVLMSPAEGNKSHGIQGVNDGADFLLDKSAIHQEIKIETQLAIKKSIELSSKHGLLVGISSGANVLAAEKYVQQSQPDGIVVTMLCDRGERYTSIYSMYGINQCR